jgi:hypothetical protein
MRDRSWRGCESESCARDAHDRATKTQAPPSEVAGCDCGLLKAEPPVYDQSLAGHLLGSAE